METTPNPRPSFLTPKSIGIFLAGIILLTLVVVGSLSMTNKSSDSNQRDHETDQNEIVNLAPYTITYGTWSENSSAVYSYDLSTGEEKLIASLPVEIKKVSILSSQEVLYIGQTDLRDHGREIVKYNLDTKIATVIFQSSEGFGIDDYVLSPDRSKISLWEVQVNDDSGTLLGGKSKVFTASLGHPGVKNLIYDEDSTLENPVRYPRAILNDGTVYMDRFLPNNGVGWSYGMSKSNFTGTQKGDIEDMPNGTYGTQPILSSDGKYLAFVGFSGNKEEGASLVNGFRRSITALNTVELFDVATQSRINLLLPTNNKYISIGWGNDSNTLRMLILSPDQKTAMYTYDVSSKELTAVTPTTDTANDLLLELSPKTWLIGSRSTSPSTLGNLGEIYSAPFTSLSVYDSQAQLVTELNTSSASMQLISVTQGYPFDNFIVQVNSHDKRSNSNNLQLKTFSIKPKLATKREDQQSKPRGLPEQPLPEVTDQPQNPDSSKTPKTSPSPKPPKENTSGLPYCGEVAESICGKSESIGDAADVCQRNLPASGQCYDSPLYLYGKPNQKVIVTVHTPIYNSNVPYTNNVYDVILLKNGKMNVSGSEVQSIAYDYQSALRRTTRPQSGIVVKKDAIQATLNEMAKKLALNEKETSDLVAYGKSVATGNYIFVSFFDQATSHAILPITFNPTPDVYRNIVFYFKNLDQKPNHSVPPPVFDPIKRHGFTAVEISGIVELE